MGLNAFGVFVRNGRIAAASWLTGRMLTPQEAINLAAHLVKKAMMLGMTKEDFERALEEIP